MTTILKNTKQLNKLNKKQDPMGQPMGETSRCKECNRNHYTDTMIEGVCKNCRSMIEREAMENKNT